MERLVPDGKFKPGSFFARVLVVADTLAVVFCVRPLSTRF